MEPAPVTSALASEPLVGWLSCPKCSRRARQGQPFCEQCGERLFAPGASDLAVQRRSFACRQCGATVKFEEGRRTAACPFCDTPYVGEGELAPDRFPPEFVVPFAVTEAQAREKFRAFLARGGWFVPGDLRTLAALQPPRGVYLPFWSFSTRSQSRWRARIGEVWYETVTETRTVTVNGRATTQVVTRQVRRVEWYPLSGAFHQYHAHYLVCGSRGLPQRIADAIQPFPVAEAVRYAPHYLSGWLAEEYSVERDDASRTSAEVFAQRERASVAAFLPGDEHADLHVETEFSDTTTDLLLLPVWVLAFTYRGRTRRFVVNGATGKEWGEKPVSARRIVVAAVLGIALLVGLYFLVQAFGG
jgi:hypothetical protein